VEIGMKREGGRNNSDARKGLKAHVGKYWLGK
jgi:hypothetical protein